MADQPSRQRDLWRTLWRLAAGDRSLAILLFGLAVTIALALAIPQLPPTLSETGPWLAQVRARFGPAVPVMNALGLFSIGDSPLFRFLLALLTLTLLIRATDRAVDLATGRRPAESDREEEAWQTLTVEDQEAAARRLAKGGHRILPLPDGVLQADRWPIAEGLAFLAHLGPILIIVGLAIGVVWGWRADGLQAQPGEVLEIAGRGEFVVPELTPTGRAGVGGVRLYAEGAMPELTVTAVGPEGEPLGLTQTPEAEPSAELVFRLSDETPSTYFAIPDAALFVRLTLDPEIPVGADAPILVQVFRIRSGEQVTAGTLAESSAAFEAADGVEIETQRDEYLVLTAIHDPGYWGKIIGLLVAGVAVMGRALWPPRRLWVRASDDGPEGCGHLPPWAVGPSDDGEGLGEKGSRALRFLTGALAPLAAAAALWSLTREGMLWAGAAWQVAGTAVWLVILGIWLMVTE